MKELQRNFSPITSQKTFGLRIGVAKNKSPSKMSEQQKLNKTMGIMTLNSMNQVELYGSETSPSHDSTPLMGFGDIKQHEENVFEGQCFLKTKTDRYKEHWALLAGNELYCYRQRGDKDHRVMHSMVGTFIKEMAGEVSQSENCTLYPVKIMLPPNKSRILYFKKEQQQLDWLDKLRKVVGYANMFDFYQFEDNLGKGQFGLVKLATHKKTGKKVAIKTVHKKDMKPIEIY